MNKLAALTLLLILSLAAAARAQTPAPAAPTADAEGFVPVDGSMLAKGESIPAAPLVGAAYGFIFAAVAAYAASVAARTRRVEQEAAELKRKIESAAGAQQAR